MHRREFINTGLLAAVAAVTGCKKEEGVVPTTTGMNPEKELKKVFEGWIYPGDSACDVERLIPGAEYDVLKPEYFTITNEGNLALLTEEERGCNGFNKENIELVKSVSEKQFITVSANYQKMNALLMDPDSSQAAITKLVNFVNEHDVTGIEIDFEGFGQWEENDYQLYKKFLQELGTQLHENGRELSVDVPAISNQSEQGNYLLKYEELDNLPIDNIVIMAYDRHRDYGAGTPISPDERVNDVINLAKSKIKTTRVVIGVPTYGYEGETDNLWSSITNKTHNQIFHEIGNNIDLGERDASSGELKVTVGNKVYFFPDEETIRHKLKVIQDALIVNGYDTMDVSFWHVGGGNPTPKK